MASPYANLARCHVATTALRAYATMTSCQGYALLSSGLYLAKVMHRCRRGYILSRLCLIVVGGISCQGFARVPVAMNQWDITSTESSCGVAAQKRRKFQQRGRWNAPQSEARREPARSAPEGPARGCAGSDFAKVCVCVASAHQIGHIEHLDRPTLMPEDSN